MRFDFRRIPFHPSLAMLAILAAGFMACGKSREAAGTKGGARPAAQASLIGSQRTPDLESLHDTVAARALRGDTLGLLRILVNDTTYRDVVWPVQPSYEPGREEVWNLVTAMHKSNSNKGLRRLLHDIAQPGSGPVIRLPLSPVPVAGGVLHEILKSERTASGVALFGSALCLDGLGCQVLSYAQGGQRGSAGENGDP